MSAYMILIREKMRDEAAFGAYAEAAANARDGHDMDALAFYGAFETLEGAAPEGVVVLKFPDMAAARAWYDSPVYSKARLHRFQGADYRVILVEGIDAAG
jgi:uncharacterized protein (DUF1330 family)